MIHINVLLHFPFWH